jgi:acetylornithine aminotransferase
MMLDEIQTGMCRSGQWFAFQNKSFKGNAAPDVMTLAKALGNGVPIGACLARGVAAQQFKPGNHGSTYGGNPLVCKTALTVIETLEKEKLAPRAAELGAYIIAGFEKNLAGVDGVNEIRGQGMLIAIELNRPCAELVKTALDNGLLINVTAEKVVRLLPPLIMSDAEADQLIAKLSDIINQFLAAA